LHNSIKPHFPIIRVSLIVTQFVILPILQRHASPRTLLQIACIVLICAYALMALCESLYEFLFITAIQTGAYAVAYAESSTQITRHYFV
jgi:hypothetical protein